MLISLRDVIQEASKGGLLHFFKLCLHLSEIGSQLQLQAIIKMNLVSRVNTFELQVIA
jgi:hypothetical protein